jgi:hypothetical protein
MTTKEQALVDKAKKLMPTQFLARITDDEVILAFCSVVLSEINCTPPATSYTIENMPTAWEWLVAFGAQVYATMFLQGGYALEDFSYSDGGLSLSISKTGNLGQVYANAYANWSKLVTNLKKVQALTVGTRLVSTPQFSAVFSQYLGMIFPGTYAQR